MKRDKVISSSIKSMGWEDGKLEVEFSNGSVYLYHGVPMETFQNLRISKSIGKSLRSDVITAGFKTVKINGPQIE